MCVRSAYIFFFMMRNYSGVREECVYFFVLHIVIQWMMRNYSGVRDSFVIPCKFSLQTILIKRNFYSYCNVWLFIAIAFCLCAFPLLLFLFSTMSNFCLFTSQRCQTFVCLLLFVLAIRNCFYLFAIAFCLLRGGEGNTLQFYLWIQTILIKWNFLFSLFYFFCITHCNSMMRNYSGVCVRRSA